MIRVSEESLHLLPTGYTLIDSFDSVYEVTFLDEVSYDHLHIEYRPQALYDAKLKSCIEKREKEYAKLNQDEMRFDDQLNGTNIWFTTINAIKAQFPKPTPLLPSELDVIPTGL